ncbi:MAG: dihydroorotate dehydrogenase [bacterium]
MDLSVNIAGIELKNPVILASGTCGLEQAKFTDFSRLGAIITKSVTLDSNIGNPPPRVAETHCGMLNSIGLENPGTEKFIANKLPLWLKYNTPVIISVAGKSQKEYIEVIEMFESTPVSGFEINVSCPNVEHGIEFCKDANNLGRLCSAIKKVTTKLVIIKLSPNVTDIQAIALSAENNGADAISLINTVHGLKVDLETKSAVLGKITGGLSGPCIKPVALSCVYKVSLVCKIPIIGMGGIMNAEDALEFIVTGASAIEIGTANFVNPNAGIEIINGMEKYCEKHKIPDIKSLIKSRKF